MTSFFPCRSRAVIASKIMRKANDARKGTSEKSTTTGRVLADRVGKESCINLSHAGHIKGT